MTSREKLCMWEGPSKHTMHKDADGSAQSVTEQIHDSPGMGSR